jgi:hypothetical protein
MSTAPRAMEIVSRLIAQHPEECAKLAFHLWTGLAAELAPIVGETGFTTLYARSLHITQRTFTWLAPISGPQQAEPPFTFLQTKLAEQASPEAAKACEAMLHTFIDILAVLIGEPLTNGIFLAAWGDDASTITIRISGNE